MDLAVETIVQLEVALLTKAAAPDVALAKYLDAMVLAKAAVRIFLGAFQLGLLAADHLQNIALESLIFDQIQAS